NQIRPLTLEQFESLASGGLLSQALLQQELPKFITDAFGLEPMAERANFKLTRETAPIEGEEGGEPATG
ncbi:MAG: hypothetical protein KDA22_15470, partial [Phycisphaerales bacterium]|nr:hypothetical protein [Phycisphaerales bacterium]